MAQLLGIQSMDTSFAYCTSRDAVIKFVTAISEGGLCDEKLGIDANTSASH